MTSCINRDSRDGISRTCSTGSNTAQTMPNVNLLTIAIDVNPFVARCYRERICLGSSRNGCIRCLTCHSRSSCTLLLNIDIRPCVLVDLATTSYSVLNGRIHGVHGFLHSHTSRDIATLNRRITSQSKTCDISSSHIATSIKPSNNSASS